MMIPRTVHRFSRSASSLEITNTFLLFDHTSKKRPQAPVHPLLSFASHNTSFSRFFSSNKRRGPPTLANRPLAQKQQQREEQGGTINRRLDVAIVGAPNAGKSQLLNALTNSQVAAVSRKRHTTRNDILGTRTVDDTQLVFVDTPGYLRSKSARKERLVRDLTAAAGAEIDTADYTLLVIDSAKRIDEALKEAFVLLMLRAVNSKGRLDDSFLDLVGTNNREESADVEDVIIREKFAIVLNKVDLVNPKKKLLEIAAEIGELGDACVRFSGNTPAPEILMRFNKESENKEGEEQNLLQDDDDQLTEEELHNLAIQSPTIFYISALKNDGIDDILNHLLTLATPCDETQIIPPDQITTMSPIERVEEVLREKIYRCLHREVPHKVKQVNKSFRKVKDPSTGQRAIIIDHELVVRTKSHQRLVRGRADATLRRIKDTAQRDLERLFDCPVLLNLHVRHTKAQHDMPLDASSLGVQEFNMW
mmetsp:Transcript_56779/g.84451  ORF Transcript_56779/g.84451 Transcript_56779/m.84451 type:complete len:478 (+) Transcript_56779:1083-2516(+)